VGTFVKKEKLPDRARETDIAGFPAKGRRVGTFHRDSRETGEQKSRSEGARKGDSGRRTGAAPGTPARMMEKLRIEKTELTGTVTGPLGVVSIQRTGVTEKQNLRPQEKERPPTGY